MKKGKDAKKKTPKELYDELMSRYTVISNGMKKRRKSDADIVREFQEEFSDEEFMLDEMIRDAREEEKKKEK